MKYKGFECTECGAKIKVSDMLTDAALIKKYGEGCTYLGHIIKKSRLKGAKWIRKKN